MVLSLSHGMPALTLWVQCARERTMSEQESRSILSQTALARLRQSGFTSDLSVNEFTLLHESGFEPLGLVMGSSIYHIGYQFQIWNQSQELQVLTQAMYTA